MHLRHAVADGFMLTRVNLKDTFPQVQAHSRVSFLISQLGEHESFDSFEPHQLSLHGDVSEVVFLPASCMAAVFNFLDGISNVALSAMGVCSLKSKWLEP